MALAGYYFSKFTLMQYLDFCLRLLVAFVIGGAIGLERSSRFKEAGVRLSTLSNYGSLIDEATSAGVVKASDAEVLRSWRLNPANWGND